MLTWIFLIRFVLYLLLGKLNYSSKASTFAKVSCTIVSFKIDTHFVAEQTKMIVVYLFSLIYKRVVISLSCILYLIFFFLVYNPINTYMSVARL